MFMFRSRRATLTRRLLKARRRRRDASPLQRRDDDVVATLLGRLRDNQLDMLWKAVEGRGGDCVLLPIDHQPHVICCMAWRWPDLREDIELKRMPTCRSAGDPIYVCCNPYHWSRVYQPDISPPAYSRCAVNKELSPSEGSPPPRQFPGSLTTNINDSFRNPSEWCLLAYWELEHRVGPLYPVESPAVNIFGDVPYCDGLSLETLAQQNNSAPESVRHGRCKIGLGITLSLEGDSVWLYNRSEHPVFVNSPSLDLDSPLPTRVPPEQCLCVFDLQSAGQVSLGRPVHGPVDPNSVRLSFAKGWGPSYKRQDIKACPCWIEILLAPCR